MTVASACRTPPRALTIAGSDSGGGAGIQADLKTFLACGVHGMSAITAVTAQNSIGVHGIVELPAAAVAAQIEAVLGDIGAGAAKTGMLSSAEIIETVADTLARLRDQRSWTGLLVVDPVAVSKHGDSLLRADAVTALKARILPMADLVTPNLGEVELLTGAAVAGRANLAAAAAAVHALGPRWVLVKGGHLPDSEDAVDLLYDGVEAVEILAARLPARHTHGTGCTLSAAITAALARGADMPTAVRAGKAFVTTGIREGYPLGSGIGPVGHLWAVRASDLD